MPVAKPYRLPKDNPRWKISEDSSAFAAHIINKQDYHKTQPKLSPNSPLPNMIKADSTLKSQLISSPPKAQTSQLAESTVPIPTQAPPPNASKSEQLPPSSVQVQASAEITPKKISPDAQKPEGWHLHPSLVDLLKDPVKHEKYLASLPDLDNVDDAPAVFRRVQGTIASFDDDKVSNDGVEDIRAVTGEETQLADWDGKLMAPPIEFSTGASRPFNSSFIPAFVQDWTKQAPAGPSVTVPRDTPEFILGAPISNTVFLPPVLQPDTRPGKSSTIFESSTFLNPPSSIICLPS